MCYYKSLRRPIRDLADRFQVRYSPHVEQLYVSRYVESGFSHDWSPIITREARTELQLYTWGLIPWWVKTSSDAASIRTKTLNCISEEMYTKPSFRDAVKGDRRCIIPCTGFFEWRHIGKEKIPYFISVPSSDIFGIAGLYGDWTDRVTGNIHRTYTLLTTAANSLMAAVHNSKHRMPVILPLGLEKDWLNDGLSEEDVYAFCKPIESNTMTAHPISKMITDRKIHDKNVPDVIKEVEYPGLPQLEF